MKIIVAGGLGSIGKVVVKEAHKRGYEVTVLEIKNSKTKKAAKVYKKYYKEIIWSDIRDIKPLVANINDKEIIINLIALIPPKSEENITSTHDINVKGLENIINAIILSRRHIKLIHISAISVIGDTQAQEAPIIIDAPYNKLDIYSETKITCEQMLDISKVDWCILRPTLVLKRNYYEAIDMINTLVNFPLNNRIETIVDVDLATAILNVAEIMKTNSKLIHKKLFIGGGEKNGHWHIHKELVKDICNSVRINMPEKKSFNTNKQYCDWVDSSEAQKLLNYQNMSFKQYIEELKINKKYSFTCIGYFLRTLKRSE